MGIKFRCPNGHKLHVKSFLAGKRGICPHCGVKVRIPEASVTADEADDSPESDASIEGGISTAVATAAAKSIAESSTATSAVARPSVTSAAPVSAAPVVAVTPVSVTPTVTPAAAAAPTPTPIAPVVAATPVVAVAPTTAVTPVRAPVEVATAPVTVAAGSPVTVAVAPTAAPPIPAPAAPPDPILEAPNAVWYVRPPSGGQFGPARGDVMRKWISEGRVSADSLVWRDGWEDWKTAVAVFPTLAPAVPGLDKGLAGPRMSESSAAASVSRVMQAKKRSNGVAIGMVVTLGLLALVLLAVFIFVVLSGLNAS